MPARSPVAWAVDSLRPSAYGKFLSNGYPFLFWEPDAEVDIANVTGEYLLGPTTPAGLRFAINMDAVQFAVYASTAARTDPKAGTTSREPGASVVAPVSAAPPVGLGAARLHVLGDAPITATAPLLSDGVLLVVLEHGPSLGFALVPPGVAAPVAAPLPAALPTGTLALPRDLAAHCTPSTTSTITCRAIVALPPSASGAAGSVVLALYVLSADAASGAVRDVSANVSVTLSLCPSCTSYAVSFIPTGESSTGSPVAVVVALDASGARLCAAVLAANLTADPTSTACVSLPGLPAGADNLTLAGFLTRPGEFSLAVAWSQSDTVHGALLTFARGAGAVLRLASGPHWLQAGRDPRLTALPSVASPSSAGGGAPWLALGVSAAFCYNTEQGNKQPEPATCDQEPSATPYVLSATVGTLSAWERQLAPPIRNGPALTPCRDVADATDVLLHSVFDMGTGASVVLRRDSTGGVEAVAAHAGIPTAATPPAATSACGLPLPFDGVAVSIWQAA